MRRPHPTGEGAMRMLEREGFNGEGYVDIFDGGPTMSAPTDQIHTVRDAQDLVVAAIGKSEGAPKMMLAAGGLGDFAAGYGHVAMGAEGAATVDPAAAELLGLKPGDRVLAVAR
jgi:arginine N-succinyltransferase